MYLTPTKHHTDDLRIDNEKTLENTPIFNKNLSDSVTQIC